jgi:allantoin racemase
VKLLFANGNTNETVTRRIAEEARRSASANTEIIALTASLGAGIVTTPAENTVACDAVFNILKANEHLCDAAVIAISFDSGIEVAQSVLSIPVIGITQAALHTASLLGPRIGMITFGSISESLYRELLDRYGMTSRVVAFEIIEFASLSEYTQAGAFDDRVERTAIRLAESGRVDAIVICGAANAGIARRLRQSIPVPIVDGVSAATQMAEALVKLNVKSNPQTRLQ